MIYSNVLPNAKTSDFSEKTGFERESADSGAKKYSVPIHLVCMLSEESVISFDKPKSEIFGSPISLDQTIHMCI